MSSSSFSHFKKRMKNINNINIKKKRKEKSGKGRGEKKNEKYNLLTLFNDHNNNNNNNKIPDSPLSSSSLNNNINTIENKIIENNTIENNTIIEKRKKIFEERIILKEIRNIGWRIRSNFILKNKKTAGQNAFDIVFKKIYLNDEK